MVPFFFLKGEFMTEFERKQLDILKVINRNLNYLGRKLEETNKILENHGIAIFPTVEETKKPIDEIVLLDHKFYDTSELSDDQKGE
jgi:hypothetical protein